MQPKSPRNGTACPSPDPVEPARRERRAALRSRRISPVGTAGGEGYEDGKRTSLTRERTTISLDDRNWKIYCCPRAAVETEIPVQNPKLPLSTTSLHQPASLPRGKRAVARREDVRAGMYVTGHLDSEEVISQSPYRSRFVPPSTSPSRTAMSAEERKGGSSFGRTRSALSGSKSGHRKRDDGEGTRTPPFPPPSSPGGRSQRRSRTALVYAGGPADSAT
ncbi:hypothetical protein B0H16DRAFT_1453373 [Mycena metata]|uniref:Uncharacterized protein n=1 Tax=Mycena metata TaxID=1033252 RepID=A0AAD7JPL4_9AGAR|nr:hypothetical protein B0H16DRAFT_1453373 [Mycena metata]